MRNVDKESSGIAAEPSSTEKAMTENELIEWDLLLRRAREEAFQQAHMRQRENHEDDEDKPLENAIRKYLMMRVPNSENH